MRLRSGGAEDDPAIVVQAKLHVERQAGMDPAPTRTWRNSVGVQRLRSGVGKVHCTSTSEAIEINEMQRVRRKARPDSAALATCTAS